MSKFNSVPTAASVMQNHPTATINFEGGLAFTMTAKTRLYTRVATSLVGEQKFYQQGAAHDSDIRKDIAEVAAQDPEFVLRLAAYVRQVLNLRSVPVLMLVEASRIPACKPFVRQWTPQIVQRADELTEVMSYWIKQYGQVGDSNKGGEPLPRSLQKGLADAFGQFDEYRLAKYDRKGAVTLRDVLRLATPKPATPAQSALYRYLITGEVQAEYLPKLAAKEQLVRKSEFDDEAKELIAASGATWEVVTSQFGSSKEVWEAVAPNMGYMAKLRNLRNFLEKEVEMEPILRHLTNENAVRHSKQLPFRFYSAYREVQKSAGVHHGAVLQALTQALETSVMNLPRLSGTTFITMDNSYSMKSELSAKSSVTYAEVANLLGAIAHSLCDRALTSVFACSHAPVTVNPADSILANMDSFVRTNVGCATNAWLAIRWLREQGHHVDRMIILSDCQCYSTRGYGRESLAEELLKYRSSINPDVFVHSVDLAGYGTSQFPEDAPRVALWAGWSERTLEGLTLFEEDKRQAVDRIAEWTPNKRPTSTNMDHDEVEA